MNERFWIVAMIFLASCARQEAAQDSATSDTGAVSESSSVGEVSGTMSDVIGHAYVRNVVRHQTGDVPQMGWFVPPDRFFAGARLKEIYVLSHAASPRRGLFNGAIDSTGTAAISREHGVACSADSLFEYHVAQTTTERGRALYLRVPFTGAVDSGAPMPRLTEDALAAARKSIPVAESNPAVFIDTVIGLGTAKPYYSVHGAYGQDSTLLGSALLLHDVGGRVVGSDLRTAASYEECDGCSVPTLDLGVRALYAVESVYGARGFRYPILLIDTSTLEGRALSLVTFTPLGEYSEFRVYEYVVGCGSRATNAPGG